MRSPAIIIITLAASTGLAHAATNIVNNGNFSGGDTTVCHNQTCPGWTVTQAPSGSAILFNDDAKDVVVPAGTGYISFGATQGIDDELSQVLATVPGRSYTVSFLLAASGVPQDHDFSVQWNGTTIFSEINNLPTVLTPYSIDPVVAAGSTTTLAFFGANPPATSVLADVSVVADAVVTGVPEPSTWSMMLLGFVGMVFALRQKRRKISIA
jgi:hypothetical protein